MIDRVQSKAARLRRIEHRLYNVPNGMRVIELSEYCGVDRRTIYRDLMTLHDMGVPVWEHAGRYGINRETYLSTVRLNLNETIALFFAVRLLAHHSDEHNPHVVSALSKLATGLPDATISGHIAQAAEEIRTRPLRDGYVRVFEALTRGWADRKRVSIQYRSADGKLTERVICPYFLEVARREPGAYVIAYDDLRGALRTFKIERINDAELLDNSYDIPADFDPHVHLSSSWGVMDEPEVEVQLRFSASVAHRVEESRWHHSQQVRTLDDGGCEVVMRVNGIREIRMWVLGWGSDVEVLAPDELRQEVYEHVQRMLQRYAMTDQAYEK
ncbi:MAG: WYL domain-containing transcriptional regulator [Chloroflexi bacterium AL-W]|nr:WYL domain-containing transcriptional regulator [Chloroflexi bacterium AL-N1]NOK67003.1 WYL domain-containing transcriptional regulator [Chloroflexi bacterium AL-N10]NOK74705.1 WYL domain-containing transcriptional regulator [Chloroflexi bacterium AL-N5]NOK81605.1 WYL domain-containing transcriptional regulator [Chloroflexi bacterium AL-W]NOK89075.1 WYL domain-containing transcriptional regulator [Chloroflexi bacterium AL-N15]